MPRCRFVRPSVVRLSISEGDWFDVKRELTYGEEREMFAAMRRASTPEDPNPAGLDTGKVGPARLLAYLLAWSFVDFDGHPVEVSAGAVDQLDGPTVAEMFDVLDKHDETIRTARRAVTDFPSGESVSSPILPSAA